LHRTVCFFPTRIEFERAVRSSKSSREEVLFKGTSPGRGKLLLGSNPSGGHGTSVYKIGRKIRASGGAGCWVSPRSWAVGVGRGGVAQAHAQSEKEVPGGWFEQQSSRVG